MTLYKNASLPLPVFSNVEIGAAFSLQEAIVEVEKAFILLAEGNMLDSNMMHLNAEQGEYHVKGGVVKYAEEEVYFGLKANGRFVHNRELYSLPNINGVIYLSDARNGLPLCVLDSAHITKVRTGAATAVAVKYLAKADANFVTICGAGVQGKIQLEAVAQVRPLIKAFMYDQDKTQAKKSAQSMQQHLGMEVVAIERPEEGTLHSDIIVTSTPSTNFYISREMVKDTAFIAAVGADSPGKQELSPGLVASSRVVSDLQEQAVRVGELQYQSPEKIKEIVLGELHEFVTREKEKPTANRPLIFDSTGTALQDIAAAVAVWKKIALGMEENLR